MTAAALDADEMEWQALAYEFAQTWTAGRYVRMVDTGGGRVGKPHPQSYRPDLPLRGFTDAALTAVTPRERAAYAARPLELFPTEGPSLVSSARAMSGPKAIERARARFDAFGIIDRT